MNPGRSRSRRIVGLLVMAGPLVLGMVGRAQEPEKSQAGRAPMPRPLDDQGPDRGRVVVLPPSPPSILPPELAPIDLNSALRLAGVQNPDLLVARQRVAEAEALRQFAAAQFLPSLNAGLNYDSHTGNLQQSNGNILSVNRSALYVGAGANAIAAGSVNIPGVVLTGNPATVVYGFLASRQVVRQREAAAAATQNDVFLAICLGYNELVRAEGRLAVARQSRDEARELARLTAEYAATGEGREADADRAATELARREADVQVEEGRVLTASARLCELVNLDPSLRLHPTDAYAVPLPIVPGMMPLKEQIAVALLRRPELAERRAAIREALYALDGAKLLPFSPNVLIGFSGGGFGGGSNLVRPIFGGFAGRTDLDALSYWTLQNLGVGNVALIRAADARAQAARFQELAVLNRVRSEVAQAQARSFARFNQIAIGEAAVRSGRLGFVRDYDRLKSRAEREILPIELLDNFRLLARARYDYLDAIVDFNQAQYQLFVAMGLPPADVLARPAPSDGAPAAPGAMPVNAPPAPSPIAPRVEDAAPGNPGPR